MGTALDIWKLFYLNLLLKSFVIWSNFEKLFPEKFHFRNTDVLRSSFFFCFCPVIRTRTTYLHRLWFHTCNRKWARTSIWIPFPGLYNHLAVEFVFIVYVKSTQYYTLFFCRHSLKDVRVAGLFHYDDRSTWKKNLCKRSAWSWCACLLFCIPRHIIKSINVSIRSGTNRHIPPVSNSSGRFALPDF